MSRASDSSKLVVLDPRDIPKRPDGKFAKGFTKPRTYGRKKGTPNKTTVMLKQAILDAAALVGQDGKGKDGLVGYLKMLAVKERPVYARLLERVLPLQLNVEDKSAPKYTASEAIARQSGWEARDNQDGESVSRREDDCRDECRAQEFFER